MIQKVELKEIEIVLEKDENGEENFVERELNKQVVPALITNYSIKRAKDEGVMTGNVLEVIAKLKAVIDKNSDNEMALLNELDEIEFQKVIYMGVIGANPHLEIDFDEFLRKYHGDLTQSTLLYSGLIQEMYKNASTKNAFAKGLDSSTKKEKKTRSRQKSTSSA